MLIVEALEVMTLDDKSLKNALIRPQTGMVIVPYLSLYLYTMLTSYSSKCIQAYLTWTLPNLTYPLRV